MNRKRITEVDVKSRTTALHVGVAIALFVLGFVLLLFQVRWLKIAGATSFGGCQLALLFEAYRRGEMRTNWGTVRRSENPIWFRVVFCFWSAMSALFTSVLLLYAIGLVGINDSQSPTQVDKAAAASLRK
jgi:hypothetical protein